MTKRTQRLWLLATVAILALSASAAAQDKPNILVIWGDDIGWFNISAYNMGMMGYKTPNIDRIANGACFSPTPTARTVARQDARPLLQAKAPSAQGC